MAQLPPLDRHAAAESFRGAMVRHTVIAYRADHPAGLPPAGLAGGGWARAVPIRMPDTICLEERLPPGAAAVLINQMHTDADRYLPIDSTEKALFEAVDGRRSMAEIADGVSGAGDAGERRASTREFFEHLWLWDHVVFDAST